MNRLMPRVQRVAARRHFDQRPEMLFAAPARIVDLEAARRSRSTGNSAASKKVPL